MSHSYPQEAIAVVKLLPPGSAVEEIRRRLRDNELTTDDILPIAEKLAENQKWPTVDKLTHQKLLSPEDSAKLRSTYPEMIRPTHQLFSEAFCSDLANKKIDPRAIKQITLAVSLLKQGSNETALMHLLRVVEGVLTDLSLLCIKKIEQHKDTLENACKLAVNSYAIANEWGMYAKSLALNQIGVLDEFEYAALLEDLNKPRNKMFHSYMSLPERETGALIREIWMVLRSLATRIADESTEIGQKNTELSGRRKAVLRLIKWWRSCMRRRE